MNVNQKIEEKRLKKEKEYKKARKNVDDWANFSLKPQSEEDIRKRLINDKNNKTNTVCISYICANSKLSEDFIEEMCKLTRLSSKSRINKIDWFEISRHQELSEEFIIRHEDEVDWPSIFKHQNLSNEFKEKYAAKLAQVDSQRIIESIRNQE